MAETPVKNAIVKEKAPKLADPIAASIDVATQHDHLFGFFVPDDLCHHIT